MNIAGVTKILVMLGADTAAVYLLTHSVEATAVVLLAAMLYAFAGEYLDLLRDKAIRAEKLPAADRCKLENAKAALSEELQDAGIDIRRIRFHMTPDSGINAYAYGMNNIAVTKACLHSTDSATLHAVLLHEISHIRNLDAVFNRIAFLNVSAVLAGLGGLCGIFVLALWMIIALPSLFTHGCAGIMAARGISNLLGSLKNFLQHVVVAVYQTAMGLLSRRCEYRADRFAAEVGYGTQLAYFLERLLPEDTGRTTIRELLYATHPQPYQRIARLEQHSRRTEQLELQNTCL